MVHVLVVYDSKTGNTEKMALAVAKGAEQVSDVEVKVKKVEQTSPDDLLAADAVIMGSPTYFGQMSAKLKALIDESIKVHKKLGGKVGAAFTSSGGKASGAETTLLSILQAMLIHGMIISGNAAGNHHGVAVSGTPNLRTLKTARKWVKKWQPWQRNSIHTNGLCSCGPVVIFCLYARCFQRFSKSAREGLTIKRLKALFLTLGSGSFLIWLYIASRVIFNRVPLYSRFIDAFPFFTFTTLGIVAFVSSLVFMFLYLTEN
jgi:NAD(P)H dehydrogenase (quinone)